MNIATLVGYRTAGLAGALLGVLGVVLPTFTLMLVLTYYYRWPSERGLVNRLARAFTRSRWPCWPAWPLLAANSPLTWQLLVIAGADRGGHGLASPQSLLDPPIAGVLACSSTSDVSKREVRSDTRPPDSC